MPTEAEKFLVIIRNNLGYRLAESAGNYLRTGMERFHKYRNEPVIPFGASVGNLAIAVELMLKAHIAGRNPILHFKQLPAELRVLFACPETVPEDFNCRQFEADILDSTWETADLNECITIFYVFFPKQKQELQPYFKLLSRCRNASVHSLLPFFQRYDLERVAYLALRVSETLDFDRLQWQFPYSSLYVLSQHDMDFLSGFKSQRLERLAKKFAEAKKQSQTVRLKTLESSEVLAEDESNCRSKGCPSCRSIGVLSGYSETRSLDVYWDDEGQCETRDFVRTFYASSFACDHCGLRLDDAEEVRLSNMEVEYVDHYSEIIDDPWLSVEQRYPVGSRVQAAVTRLTDFGAFLELEEGIDGLIYISDMSWTRRIRHPSELLKPGDKVAAIVLHVDKTNHRISLGLKQSQPDPWQSIVQEKYRVGMNVKAKVVRLTDFGAFVEFDDGIEGLLHIAELSHERVARPEEVVNVGEELTLKIIKMDVVERKFGVSLRAYLDSQRREGSKADSASQP